MLKLGQAEWQAELELFTNEEIKKALNTFKGEFPPSLPSLVDACKAQVHKPTYQQLLKPPSNKTIATSAIAQMRRTLKGNTK
ncbi:MAG: hypothetical protein KUF72_12530 [Candidatus Thiodiazotropha sp. (ex Ctena orbiculata)]|nr:hypothetical protein [Candidatus Thiodiazotropha taylori]